MHNRIAMRYRPLRVTASRKLSRSHSPAIRGDCATTSRAAPQISNPLSYKVTPGSKRSCDDVSGLADESFGRHMSWPLWIWVRPAGDAAVQILAGGIIPPRHLAFVEHAPAHHHSPCGSESLAKFLLVFVGLSDGEPLHLAEGGQIEHPLLDKHAPIAQGVSCTSVGPRDVSV